MTKTKRTRPISSARTSNDSPFSLLRKKLSRGFDEHPVDLRPGGITKVGAIQRQ